MAKTPRRETISEMVAAANAMGTGKRKAPKAKPIQGKMVYRVDDNIPIPPIQHAKGSNTRKKTSPLHVLKVGQSVFIPKENVLHPDRHASWIAKNSTKRFTSRTLEEDGVEGTRIWRIK